PEDVEAVLATDDRLRDATVVGWPPGPDLKVHAVLLLSDPDLADAVVRTANARLGAHQQIRGFTVWPDEDLPRTATLKVRKMDVLARLAVLAGAAPEAPGRESVRAIARPPGAGEPEPLVRIIADVASLPVSAIVPTARLSSDLNLDSLQRVELLGVLE